MLARVRTSPPDAAGVSSAASSSGASSGVSSGVFSEASSDGSSVVSLLFDAQPAIKPNSIANVRTRDSSLIIFFIVSFLS